MVEPQFLHFVVRSVTYQLTDTGYIVTCFTNYPCHLWLRWTNIIPQKHINPVIVRGAPVGTYIDQCFVVFNDVEQNEAGDTYTHTFTLSPWPSCERRWFYFWGTVAGVLSPSASAIFTKHRPFISIFKSDPGSGLTTVDGQVIRGSYGEPYSLLMTGPGTGAAPATATLYADIMASVLPNLWSVCTRSIMTFNLAGIPSGHDIIEASFFLWGQGKNDTGGDKPRLALFAAYPLAKNNLVPADYTLIHSTPISNEIEYDDFHLGSYNELKFTEAGLKLVTPGSIVAYGLRESKFGAGIAPPLWVAGKTLRFFGYSVDHTVPWQHPYLRVAHSPPGV